MALVEAVLLTALAGFAAVLFLRPVWDIDIFWHLAAGRGFRELGGLVDTDFMGLDSTRHWVSFQWGYQISMSWLYELGGWPLLRGLHAAVMLLAFALFHRLHRALWGPARGLCATLVLLLLYQDRINVRPDVFNLLGLAVLMPWLLGDYETLPLRPRLTAWRARVGLALMMAVWAALHAGGEMNHLIVASALPIGAAMDAGRRRARGERAGPVEGARLGRSTTFWLLLVLPCVVMPNFVRGALDSLSLLQSGGVAIEEWSAPIAYVLGDQPQPPGRILSGLLPYATLVWLLVLALRGQLGARPMSRVGLALAFVGLSLLFVRFVYFVVPAWAALAPAAGAQPTPEKARSRAAVWWPPAVAAALFGLIWHTNVTSLHGGATRLLRDTRSDLDLRRFPVASADLLESLDFQGTVFCHARFCSYLLYRLYPKIRVLVDGRFAVSDQTAEEITRLHATHHRVTTEPAVAADIRAIVERPNTDVLVVEPPLFPSVEAACPTWARLLRTDHEEVWIRRRAVETKRLVGSTLALPPCGAPPADHTLLTNP